MKTVSNISVNRWVYELNLCIQNIILWNKPHPSRSQG
nr:MAG TPA_asm: hypothetical protein [Caudoviricetes sp.]